MGIRSLQTYITQFVKNGTVPVDIKEEIEKYRRQHNGEMPLIVIDLLSIHPLFYTNKQELVLGARYNVYKDRVIDLFSRIKSYGVRLVFFTDGPAREEKLPTCLKRRNNEYQRAMQALQVVYSGADLRSRLEDMDVASPVPFFGILRKMAKEFGDLNIAVRNECDIELADYATKNGALAIISNDTDFLIFEGDWKFWSSGHLNVFRLKTLEFNRQALRETLGLRPDQMAILATMSGNDLVPYDSVRRFHFQIKQRDRFHFRATASKILSLRLSTHTITDDDVRYITQLIFNNYNDREEDIKLVETSLKSYDYSRMNTEYNFKIPLRDVSDYGKFNYIILANVKYIVQCHHFDLSKKDLLPYFDIFSPLIRRIMGILLNHVKNDNSRRFYFKLDHNRDYEEVILNPEYPPCEVPPIDELLYENTGVNPHLDRTRLELACWQISSKLTPETLGSLPTENISNVATLLYLVELGQIDVDEADCLLLACNCPKDVCYSLRLNDIRYANERDVRLAFLFTSVLVYIRNCFCAVGLDDLRTLITFDGLYFHTLRQSWNVTDRAALLRPFAAIRIYAR